LEVLNGFPIRVIDVDRHFESTVLHFRGQSSAAGT
jgi:hypothetical protein